MIIIRPILTIAAVLLLAGCDWIGGSSADTDMRNVEILPGTASDEMITLDQASGDGTAIDTSIAVVPTALSSAGDDAADSATDAAADSGESPDGSDASTSGDVVIRPPSGGAEPSGPAPKN